jgi:hypothetical protein
MRWKMSSIARVALFAGVAASPMVWAGVAGYQMVDIGDVHPTRAAQLLLNQLQPHLEFIPDEEVTMFISDVPPDAPALYAQVIVAPTKRVGWTSLMSTNNNQRYSKPKITALGTR